MYGYQPGYQPGGVNCSDYCPSRGPALAHAHGSDCNGEHPNNMCCHCGATMIHPAGCRHKSGNEAPKKEVKPADEQPPARQPEEPLCLDFRWTITGRCGRCAKNEDSHPIRKEVKDGECFVDHALLKPALLIGDEGLDWRPCPNCGERLEPKVAGAGPQGHAWEPGRGVLTQRLSRRLEFIAFLATRRGEL